MSKKQKYIKKLENNLHKIIAFEKMILQKRGGYRDVPPTTTDKLIEVYKEYAKVYNIETVVDYMVCREFKYQLGNMKLVTSKLINFGVTSANEIPKKLEELKKIVDSNYVKEYGKLPNIPGPEYIGYHGYFSRLLDFSFKMKRLYDDISIETEQYLTEINDMQINELKKLLKGN